MLCWTSFEQRAWGQHSDGWTTSCFFSCYEDTWRSTTCYEISGGGESKVAEADNRRGEGSGSKGVPCPTINQRNLQKTCQCPCVTWQANGTERMKNTHTRWRMWTRSAPGWESHGKDRRFVFRAHEGQRAVEKRRVSPLHSRPCHSPRAIHARRCPRN